MQGKFHLKSLLKICVAAGALFLGSVGTRGQEARLVAYSNPPSEISEAPEDVRALAGLVRDLEAQVQTLNSQLGDLRAEQERASAEALELRRELNAIKPQGAPPASGPLNPYGTPPVKESAGRSGPASSIAPPVPQTQEDRIAKLEEDQQVIEDKIDDQYQTKVESGSKYRLRLSGIALLNLFGNRGTVDNLDFPEFAESQQSQAPNRPLDRSAERFGNRKSGSRRSARMSPARAPART